jgi:cardiolipin-specific phospholipase
MLKTYPTTFLLPKRLKLASLVARRDPDTSPSASSSGPCSASAHTSSLSTDASLPTHQDPRQPLLLVSHQAMAQSRADTQTQTQRTMAAAYFPLGYKEAAQQWVSCALCLPHPTSHTAKLTQPLTVDKCIRAPG